MEFNVIMFAIASDSRDSDENKTDNQEHFKNNLFDVRNRCFTELNILLLAQ